jgi:hypothetical protein
MSEKDLAKALLQLGATELANPPGSPEQTQRVLVRDRRRVFLLAALALVFWLGSALVLYWFMFELLGFVAREQHNGQLAVEPHVAAVYRFLFALAASVEALMFALFCTMILLFVSRRAALRQINANLIEISLKLQSLAPHSGRPPGPTAPSS